MATTGRLGDLTPMALEDHLAAHSLGDGRCSLMAVIDELDPSDRATFDTWLEAKRAAPTAQRRYAGWPYHAMATMLRGETGMPASSSTVSAHVVRSCACYVA